LVCEKVDYADIDPAASSYKGKKYDGIIFCEGVEVRHNPWFVNLPINDTKGETLTIRSTTLPETESLNRKCFTLPIGNNEFRVGATYDWNTYNADITEEGKKQLQEMLTYITDQDYSIIDQKAGIRPTTVDRRPLMGAHPTFKNLFVFNGLGTKGYLLAPLLAKELIDSILDGGILDKEVLVSRTLK
jgi:glycine/D-amino acid oxidase-like deaminating enzyme